MLSSNISNGTDFPLVQMFVFNENETIKSTKVRDDILPKYEMVIKTTLDAWERFLIGDLHRFDAKVGECCCQVRASFIVNFAKSQKLKQALKDKIPELKDVLTRIENKTCSNSITVGQTTKVKECLEEVCKAYITIPKKGAMIAFAYAISDEQPKKACFYKKSATDPLDFKEAPESASKKKQGIDEKKARKALAEYSVKYIQKIAGKQNWNCPYLAQGYVKANKLGLVSLPVFAGMQAIWTHSLASEVPIILKVRMIDPDTIVEISHFIKVFIVEKGGFQEISPTDADQNAPSIVMEGFVPSKEKSDAGINQLIRDVGIETIIKGNLAVHPQYPGDPNLDGYGDEHRGYVEEAYKHGFSKNNPSGFRLYHIYAGSLGGVK